MLKLFAKFIFPQKALILNDSITFVIDQEWCVCQTLRSRLIKTWFPVSSGAYYRKKWASFLSLSPNDKNINVRIPFFFVCLCGETWGRDYTSQNEIFARCGWPMPVDDVSFSFFIGSLTYFSRRTALVSYTGVIKRKWKRPLTNQIMTRNKKLN